MSQAAGAPPGHVERGFFVVLAPYVDFGFSYPPLGTIGKGFDVVERIAALGPPATRASNPGSTGVIGNLRQTVLIEKISIEKG